MGNIGNNYTGIDLGTKKKKRYKEDIFKKHRKQNIRNSFGGQGRHKFKAHEFKYYQFSMKRVGIS